MLPFVSIINLDGVLVSYQIIANKDKTYTAKLLKCSDEKLAAMPAIVTVRRNEDLLETENNRVAKKLAETIKKMDAERDEVFNR